MRPKLHFGQNRLRAKRKILLPILENSGLSETILNTPAAYVLQVYEKLLKRPEVPARPFGWSRHPLLPECQQLRHRLLIAEERVEAPAQLLLRMFHVRESVRRV